MLVNAALYAVCQRPAACQADCLQAAQALQAQSQVVREHGNGAIEHPPSNVPSQHWNDGCIFCCSGCQGDVLLRLTISIYCSSSSS